MPLENPTIAVVGAGALGAYYGARLAHRGHPVHLLLRSDYDAVATGGLEIRSVDGDFRLEPAEINVYRDSKRMPKVDLVLVTLKATANDQYERLIAPLLKEDTAILTLQNGLGNEERLAELFGVGRVLGGLAFVCINRLAPGKIHHMDHGLIRLGEFGGGPSPRAQRICRLFNDSQINCDVLSDLRYGRWEKLVWNIPFNGLGAVLNKSTDQLINNEAGLTLVRGLMAEVIAAAKGAGVALPQNLIETKIVQTRSMGAYRSSMQIDRQMGRPLEAEAILGQPVKIAQSARISVPQMAMLYRMALLL